jgi:hypothetical protein
MNQPSFINYNDRFRNDPNICDPNSTDNDMRHACEANSNFSYKLQKNAEKQSTAKTQYENMLTMYNREVIYMVNLLIGVGVGLYYLYTNRPLSQIQNNPMVAAVKQNIATSVKK